MNWRSVANLALSTLFEPPCAACATTLLHPLNGAVCDRCWAGVHRITPPVCDRCGDPLPSSLAGLASGGTCHRCRGSAHVVDRSRAIGPYEGRLRDIIRALKYDGRRSVAPRLAAMMRSVGADVLAGADCVVPVPLHPRRERTRGFNQADDLARALGLPVVQLLRRTKATLPQVDLPAHARAKNVRGAFEVGNRRAWRPDLSADAAAGRYGKTSPKLKERYTRSGPAAGLVIVLVDDVSTTGATLEACASVLKTAGARSVRALTAARVVSGRP